MQAQNPNITVFKLIYQSVETKSLHFYTLKKAEHCLHGHLNDSLMDKKDIFICKKL